MIDVYNRMSDNLRDERVRLQEQQHFLADTSGKKFLDTESKSCAEFIARIADEKYGFEDSSLAELIEWAHIIDGALYESPAQCVELRSPALKLMQIIEGEKDPAFVERIIRMLTEMSLDEIVARTGNMRQAETECQGAALGLLRAAAYLAILTMVSRMREKQTALLGGDDSRCVVKQIVRMRHQDRTYPALAVMITGPIQPE